MGVLYFIHEDLEFQAAVPADPVVRPRFFRKSEDYPVRVFPEKISVPRAQGILARKRLIKALDTSSNRIGATLIQGRAGTGKTTLAAVYAQNYERVSWYSVDSVDSEWNVFFRYFQSCFNDPHLIQPRGNASVPNTLPSSTRVAHLIESLLARLGSIDQSVPRLLVLDNIHNVFDAGWFNVFLNSLIHMLHPQMHLILLSRCQPPGPIWRLRSKQRLGVIDERALAFTKAEIDEFCRHYDLTPEIRKGLDSSFGRISTIKKLVQNSTR